MQIYIGGPLRVIKYRDLGLYKTIANIIRDLGFKPYIPHIETADPDKKVDESKLYKENIQALNSSSLAIFEITYPSHGVGMEIEYALSNKIPFLCIAKEGAIISKMLRGSIEPSLLIFYSDLRELKRKLKRKIGQELHSTSTGNLGRFITFEGIDFTGKSTLCLKIERALREQKWNVITVCDPPLIPPWQDLKQFFETQEEISRLSEAFLLFSARLDNYERIIMLALKRGDIVISDRYVDSWFAYQSYMLKTYFNNNVDKTIDFLISVNDFLFRYSLLSVPDLTILIIDEPKEILKRAITRDSLSKYEDIETQKTVQNIYLELAKKFSSRFKVIDSRDKNIDDVFKEAYSLCKNLLE